MDFTIRWASLEDWDEAMDMVWKTFLKFDAPDCTPETLAPIFKGCSCAQIESVLNRAPMIAAQQGKEAFGIAEVRLAMKEH